jgi:hypothetical protein
MGFTIVPLLVGDQEIPDEVRQALIENRRQDAAELLMQKYGLSCIEAGHLLDVSACGRWENDKGSEAPIYANTARVCFGNPSSQYS